MSESKTKIHPFDPKANHNHKAEWVCIGDKSLTHRALIFSGLAKGSSEIVYPLWGDDCQSTAGILSYLGVALQFEDGAYGSRVLLQSPGWDAWNTTPKAPLDCGNSGTTARLILGVLAATPGLTAELIGDESLSKRPMMRVVKPLRDMGADIDGKDQGNLLPITINGKMLKGMHHSIDKSSAQIKSALLLAGLNISQKTTVVLPKGSRDHTERLLKKLGADIEISTHGATESISIQGRYRPGPQIYRVPGDPSSAAFFAVFVAIMAGEFELLIRRVLNNPTRSGFLNVLSRMGVKISILPNQEGDFMEPVVDLLVSREEAIQSVIVEKDEIPTLIDEIPILALAALFADGVSRFESLAELKVKESDRLAQTHALLLACGGEAYIEDDNLIVHGGLSRIQSFEFDPQGDHRLAMVAAIAGKFAEAPCTIIGSECVNVSFPQFFADLEKLFK